MNILITGCSKGIGFETALQLCKLKNNVLAIARDEDRLSKLKDCANNLGLASYLNILSYDITAASLDLEFKKIVESFIPKIDVLINNAGLLINKNFIDLSVDDFDKMFDINVRSPFRIIKVLFPLLNANSHIVNITSMGGVQGSAKFSGLSAYSASKGALNILTESLALEFAEYGISVNSLALGAVQTEMLNTAFPNYKAPLTASEMATFIAHFATEAHKYINGKIIPVSLSTP